MTLVTKELGNDSPLLKTVAPLSDYRDVQFDMRCDAERAYVLLSDQKGQPIALHQMEMERDDRWQLTVGLKPGAYRYRYFAKQGAITHFVSPSDVDEIPRRMDGLDAVLGVSSEMPVRRVIRNESELMTKEAVSQVISTKQGA